MYKLVTTNLLLLPAQLLSVLHHRHVVNEGDNSLCRSRGHRTNQEVLLLFVQLPHWFHQHERCNHDGHTPHVHLAAEPVHVLKRVLELLQVLVPEQQQKVPNKRSSNHLGDHTSIYVLLPKPLQSPVCRRHIRWHCTCRTRPNQL